MRRFIMLVGLVSAVLAASRAYAQEPSSSQAGSREGDLLWSANAGVGIWEFTVGNVKYRTIVGQAALYLGHSFDAPEDRSTAGIYWSLGYHLRVSADGSGVIHRHQIAATMRNGNIVGLFGIGPTQLLGLEGGIQAVHGGSFSAELTYHFGSSPFAITLPFTLDVLSAGRTQTFFESGIAVGFSNF